MDNDAQHTPPENGKALTPLPPSVVLRMQSATFSSVQDTDEFLRNNLALRARRVATAAAKERSGEMKSVVSDELAQTFRDAGLLLARQEMREALIPNDREVDIFQKIFGFPASPTAIMDVKAVEVSPEQTGPPIVDTSGLAPAELVRLAAERCGGITKLAARLGVARETASRWANGLRLVPVERLPALRALIDQGETEQWN